MFKLCDVSTCICVHVHLQVTSIIIGGTVHCHIIVAVCQSKVEDNMLCSNGIHGYSKEW